MPYWSLRGSDPEPAVGHAADCSNSNTSSQDVVVVVVVLCDQRVLTERRGKDGPSLWAGVCWLSILYETLTDDSPSDSQFGVVLI
jgi:hypothetical protein